MVKEWGKDTELGSWKMVVDKHGPNVAYEALRQGTLPYVPHSLLLPGHRVKWPESHEFLMERKFWKETWRDEITFEAADERADTDSQVAKWLKENQPGCNSHNLQDWETVRASASTGIPENITMECPAETAEPAETAVIKSAQERAIHPEYCGPKYDEAYTSALKNTEKVASVWQKKKKQYEIDLEKAKDHPMCQPVIASATKHIATAEQLFKELEDFNKTAQVKGKGFHSKKELDKASKDCEEVFKADLDIDAAVKALGPLIKVQIG